MSRPVFRLHPAVIGFRTDLCVYRLRVPFVFAEYLENQMRMSKDYVKKPDLQRIGRRCLAKEAAFSSIIAIATSCVFGVLKLEAEAGKQTCRAPGLRHAIVRKQLRNQRSRKTDAEDS